MGAVGQCRTDRPQCPRIVPPSVLQIARKARQRLTRRRPGAFSSPVHSLAIPVSTSAAARTRAPPRAPANGRVGGRTRPHVPRPSSSAPLTCDLTPRSWCGEAVCCLSSGLRCSGSAIARGWAGVVVPGAGTIPDWSARRMAQGFGPLSPHPPLGASPPTAAHTPDSRSRSPACATQPMSAPQPRYAEAMHTAFRPAHELDVREDRKVRRACLLTGVVR